MQEITLEFTSLNFDQGCDFNDSNGLDATIEVFTLDGAQLVENEIQDLIQVTGPAENVPFNLSTNPDCCGTGYSPSLGTYPLGQVTFTFFIMIYEADGACCNGYNWWSDDDLGEGEHTFDVLEPEGTVDVGSCISFNYIIHTDIVGTGESLIDDTVCPDFETEVNGSIYNIDNQSGIETLPGMAFGGCDSIINVDLNFVDSPLPLIIGDNFLCPDGSVVLSTETEFEQYLWSTLETTSEISVEGEEGLFSVAVVDEFGCSATAEFMLEFFDLTTLEITGDLVVCPDNPSGTLTVNDDFDIYEWEGGNDGNIFDFNESGIYGLTVTDANGCSQSSEIEVTLAMPEPLEIFGPTVLCSDDAIILSVDDQFTTSTWSNGETTNEIEITQGGMYEVIATDINGCVQSTEIEVVESMIEIPEINGPTTFCFGEIVALSIDSNYDSIVWNTGESESEIMINEGGEYSVTVSDDVGCTQSSQFETILSQVEVPEISGPSVFCADETAVLFVSQNYDSYDWSTDETIDEIIITEGGDYAVTVSDVNGCTESTEISVLQSSPEVPDISGPSIFCWDEIAVLSVDQDFETYTWNTAETDKEISISQAGDYSVTVSDINGCTSEAMVTIDQYLEYNIETDELTCLPDEEGQVVVDSMDANGCTIQVITNFIYEGDDVCFLELSAFVTDAFCEGSNGGTVQFTVESGAPPFELLIYGPDGNELVSTTINETLTEGFFEGLAAGIYTVEYIDASGNINFLEFEIGISDGPDYTLSPDQFLTVGDELELTISEMGTLIEDTNWYLDSLLVCESCNVLPVSPEITSTYQVEIFYGDNCVTFDEVTITVLMEEEEPPALPDVFIPNVINPEGDQDQSFFKPYGSTIESTLEMNIYDRWGNLVYQDLSDNANWDGRVLGGEAIPGVYVYRLVLLMQDGSEKLFFGDITLLR